MMLSIRELLALVCLFSVALVSPTEAKVRSRGNLAEFDPQAPQALGSSFPINAPPMFVAQQPIVRPADEVVLSRNRNKMIDYDKIESLVQELDRAQSPMENEINNQIILTNRDKKSKDTLGAKAESEAAPLASHRRKNFFTKDSTVDSAKTCPSQMTVQPSTILDSRTSLDNGAKFIRVEYLDLQSAKQSLNYVQEECKRLCCEDSQCDTSLLSLKLTEKNEYRCYLYQCQDQCIMVQHKDYTVFMVKDAEQSQVPVIEKPVPPVNQGSNDITTGHDHGDAHNFDMSVDTFQNSLASPKPLPNYGSDKIKLSEEDRAYFFDKSLASKSSIAMAVIILILGICLVIAFFVYLLVNTRFIAKRIKWLGKKQGNKLDVEADYLINGMYL